MRTSTVRILGIFFFALLLTGAMPAGATDYLLVSAFQTTTPAAGIIEIKGVVGNHCGTSFGPGSYFQVSSNGRTFEVPIGGLQAGGELRFARTFQVPIPAVPKPATLGFEIIVPGSPTHDTPDHYVSPCAPVIIKP